MADKKVQRTIIVFAKAPIPGEVKTRLTPFLSADTAAALHRNLVDHTLKTMTSLPHCHVELWVGSQHGWWADLVRQYQVSVFEQRGEDLGARMQFALADALQRSEQVLIVGTDCPWITPQYLQQGFDGLQSNPVVVGPADDGGYVLLGLTQSLPSLFDDMRWGGADVFADTLMRLDAMKIDCRELALLRDIDRPEDFLHLEKLKPELTEGLIPS